MSTHKLHNPPSDYRNGWDDGWSDGHDGWVDLRTAEERGNTYLRGYADGVTMGSEAADREQKERERMNDKESEQMEEEEEYTARCPVCGDYIDYCQGHGAIGDPVGFAILSAHDDGNHEGCHPEGCEDR